MDVNLFGQIYDRKAVPKIKKGMNYKSNHMHTYGTSAAGENFANITKENTTARNHKYSFLNQHFKIYHWERPFGSLTSQYFDFNI